MTILHIPANLKHFRGSDDCRRVLRGGDFRRSQPFQMNDIAMQHANALTLRVTL